MSKNHDIQINKSGAYRIRSGESGPARITPYKGTPPAPQTPMPEGQAEGVKKLHRKLRSNG
ncbi:MAG: hypothetical protein KDB48_05275 [Solirubrobacterales bacterium]|nr:hypothetical protein [Solirubrobacterales bacterium]HMT06312.1 hypothetical protein [Solirubrobacterales bacterium]